MSEPVGPGREPGDATGNATSLLETVMAHPLDEDYYTRDPGSSARRGGWAAAAAIITFAALLTIAAVQTWDNRPAEESERAQLIEQIENRKADIQTVQDDVAQVRADVERLRREASGSEARTRAEEQRRVVGTAAVVGPGLRAVVDSAPNAEAHPAAEVRDKDLQLLVNGLWQAGAEAVAINGNRLTTMSSIRGAGDAITVNYRSLSSPYTVSAIGSPRTLPGNFAETVAAQTWRSLQQNLGMRFQVSEPDSLRLPAAPRRASTIRHAEVPEVEDE
ncbi:uncharacterized protein YlxW (UPF0749 family) [Mumia flava]|uniref:Uncharacterized protein YlxW (UPF0749 family) n=1 Tax=Mumia flava TaxID=1348852 RepID=A0A2M9B634_9ACTN|nr:DUF881 domain-containing protein [Mumia flava]PJJ53404.1 uncharacterized protein YlxW (UPF0749 family) [Mumia flava]